MVSAFRSVGASERLGWFLPLLGAFQELFEALPGSEENAVEVEAVEPEVGADLRFVLPADVEAEQDVAVAVCAELADHFSNDPGLFVQEDGLELARRGCHGRGDLSRVSPGRAAL